MQRPVRGVDSGASPGEAPFELRPLALRFSRSRPTRPGLRRSRAPRVPTHCAEVPAPTRSTGSGATTGSSERAGTTFSSAARGTTCSSATRAQTGCGADPAVTRRRVTSGTRSLPTARSCAGRRRLRPRRPHRLRRRRRARPRRTSSGQRSHRHNRLRSEMRSTSVRATSEPRSGARYPHSRFGRDARRGVAGSVRRDQRRGPARSRTRAPSGPTSSHMQAPAAFGSVRNGSQNDQGRTRRRSSPRRSSYCSSIRSPARRLSTAATISCRGHAPRWLSEGTAESVAYRAIASVGMADLAAVRWHWSQRTRSTTVTLERLAIRRGQLEAG